jgi:hypothetical protein
MERVYEPLVPLSRSLGTPASGARRAAGSRHTGPLRRCLAHLWADPVGERFARERERDQRYLLGR